MERWVDFKDFPVFDEAMTYTALQFYRGRPSGGVSCIFAADGDLSGADFATPAAVLSYAELPASGAWVFLPARERAFLKRLSESTPTLDSASAIFVGVQTSADHVFQLERVRPGRYKHFPKKRPPIEVDLEDAIMLPLMSGDAKRYQAPSSSTYLLFPYGGSGERAALYSASEMESTFPNAWRYLRGHERELRAREGGAFDDEQWFRFGRNQSIDKQKLKKLGVAQTVPEMRVFYDQDAKFCLNNVRVNGILVPDDATAFFLLAVLNSRVVDFVFRRIAKPKEPRPSGAYFEANKQYIAPLPIPRVTDEEKAGIASCGQILRDLHTERYATIDAIDHRLASPQFVDDQREPKWFWGDVADVAHWKRLNPTGLRGRELGEQAKRAFEEKMEAHLAEIAVAMVFGSPMEASEDNGELKFFVGNRCIVSGVFVSSLDAPVILAQWRQKARDTFASDTMNARKVVAMLLELKATENVALIEQLAGLNKRLDAVENKIRAAERELDDRLYALYGLSEGERIMVEADTKPRWHARMPAPPLS